MDPGALANLRRFVDTSRAEVVDERATGGEVIKIPIHSSMTQPQLALSMVADNLAQFMEEITGRGYRKAEEVYDIGYTVREPGHQAYGLKVLIEQGCVIVSRVAILEDETAFRRYVHYLRTGMII
ncbi:MAG: hypothetical protein ABIL25_06405 [candidate division WOR-3 bacterium]